MITDAGNRYKQSNADPLPYGNVTDVPACTLSIIHDDGILRTLVGSSVSVCLYDRRNRIAGMNNYLFPRTLESQKATGRYGNAALIGLLQLIDAMEPNRSLIAHIAGGAYCDEFEMDLALENIHIAWKFLLVKKIPVVSQQIGGRYPREVLFDVMTGVFTAKVTKPGSAQ